METLLSAAPPASAGRSSRASLGSASRPRLTAPPASVDKGSERSARRAPLSNDNGGPLLPVLKAMLVVEEDPYVQPVYNVVTVDAAGGKLLGQIAGGRARLRRTC